MNYIVKLILVSIILFVALSILAIFRHDIRAWNDLNVYFISKDYFSWKCDGGNFKPEFHSAINMDKYRSDKIVGIDLNMAINKYSGSKLASACADGSYRRAALQEYKKFKNVDDLLFFDGQDDDFGYAILILNKKCIEILLIKG